MPTEIGVWISGVGGRTGHRAPIVERRSSAVPAAARCQYARVHLVESLELPDRCIAAHRRAADRSHVVRRATRTALGVCACRSR